MGYQFPILNLCMLAGPSHANPGTRRGVGEASRGGERIPSRDQGGVPVMPGVHEPGTSRFRRRGGGRNGDGESSSEPE